MTDKHKPQPEIDLPFDEALARFANTDPKELADALEQARRADEEAKKYVKGVEESIQRGARGIRRRARI